MSERISERDKVDHGIIPQSAASATVNGPWYSLANHDRIALVGTAGAIADGQTVVLSARQATDNAGSDDKVVTNVTATITGSARASEAQIVGDTVADGNVVTISDGTTTQVFTCEDTTPDASAGEFASGANDTEAMANLATVINSLLPRLRAVATTDTINLTVREPGEATITISAATAIRFVPSTLAASAFLELRASDLDTDNGFSHVRLRMVTNATIVIGATAIRSNGRYTPTQHVAASKSDTSA